MELERTREKRKERLDASALHVLGLDEYVRELREEPEYAANGRNGITLVKTPGLRLVLEVLRRGAELAEHRARGPITVHVLAGEIRFHAGEDTFRIREHEVLALPPARPHAVEAVRDSTLLITIAAGGEEGETA
jgi:quercetin dioxygenase-like cupin family protein